MANTYLDSNGVSHFWEKIKSKFVPKETGKGLSTNDYTTAEKNKLAGIEAGANKYVHPSGTAKSSGLYKIAVDSSGHVSGASAVSKSDITGLGIPAQDTTYNYFTGAKAGEAGKPGLVPPPAKGEQGKVLCGNGEWEEINMYYAAETYTSGALHFTMGSRIITASIPAASGGNVGLMTGADKMKLDAFQSASEYALKSDITGIYKYKGSVPAASDLPSSGQEKGDVYNIEAASTYGAAGTNVAWDGEKWDALGGMFSVEAMTNADIDSICV